MATHPRGRTPASAARSRWAVGFTTVCLVPLLAGCDLTLAREPAPAPRDGSSNVVCGAAASGGGHMLVCTRGRPMTIEP